jgi:hypothetical protein
MGQLVQVIPKRDFSFDGRAASGVVQDAPLAEGIDAAGFASGALVVRLHAKNTWASTALVEIIVQSMSPAAEEPQTLFVKTDTAVATATIRQSDSPAVPGLYVVNFASPIAGALRVLLRFTQGTTAATAAQTFSLGVDLVGRE